MDNVSNCSKCGKVTVNNEVCHCSKEKSLSNLIDKTREVTDDFWKEYWSEESMANDLLDSAVKVLNLQEGVIQNLMCKINILETNKKQ